MSQKLMLDTNVASYLYRQDPLSKLYLPHINGRHAAISFVTVSELYKGAYRKHHTWGQAKLDALAAEVKKYSVYHSNRDICLACSKVHNTLGISENDAWIAATALVKGCALVTHDAVFSDPALQNLGLSVITESGG